MARVNITIPDQLLEQARGADLNISRFAAAALSTELNRRSKLTQFDTYLEDLELLFGRISEEETAEAQAWAEHALGPRPPSDGTQPPITFVLDVAGITALAGAPWAAGIATRTTTDARSKAGRLASWFWAVPRQAKVPAIVPTETLTGDQRRDVLTNRLLRICESRR